jgi:hypothetical protein
MAKRIGDGNFDLMAFGLKPQIKRAEVAVIADA